MFERSPNFKVASLDSGSSYVHYWGLEYCFISECFNVEVSCCGVGRGLRIWVSEICGFRVIVRMRETSGTSGW